MYRGVVVNNRSQKNLQFNSGKGEGGRRAATDQRNQNMKQGKQQKKREDKGD